MNAAKITMIDIMHAQEQIMLFRVISRIIENKLLDMLHSPKI